MRPVSFLLWSALLVLHIFLAHSTTYKPDKDALLAFKASVTDPGYLLGSWSEYTVCWFACVPCVETDGSTLAILHECCLIFYVQDPCIDQWPGVSCTCYPFFETGAQVCLAAVVCCWC